MDAKKVAQYGLITALALVLSWAESLLPPLGAPGVKLGLPNLAIVFALYRLGWKDACVISLVRVVLVALLFGNGAALAYSIAGAALSLSLMGVLKRTGKFSPVGVSVAGGVAHNAGQILVAMACWRRRGWPGICRCCGCPGRWRGCSSASWPGCW